MLLFYIRRIDDDDTAVEQLLSAMMASALEEELKGQTDNLLRAMVMENTGNNEVEVQFLNRLFERFRNRAGNLFNRFAGGVRDRARNFLDGGGCTGGICSDVRDSLNEFLNDDDQGVPGSLGDNVRNNIRDGINRFLASTPSPASKPDGASDSRLDAEMMQLPGEDGDALRKLAGMLMTSWKQRRD